jgi:hypothetical protein
MGRKTSTAAMAMRIFHGQDAPVIQAAQFSRGQLHNCRGMAFLVQDGDGCRDGGRQLKADQGTQLDH